MEFITKFLIRRSSNKIGTDEFGNSYYQHKKNKKRYVIYNGIAESSKIPAQWHGWIHYSSDIAPIKINTNKASWQKIHTPNLTGTINAYSPKNKPSHKSSSSYEAWEPK
ncbi:MAG: NADH:ubiquinone oxidoreductase subunit NDUFA12 [Rickettsiales bacterium]|nr:NADH:ubiquinone oxidoreductase subunit NDUFA12 [Rickettsiales bacterium]